MARVLDVVVGGVDLERARERVCLARVRGAEAAGVHLPDVEARNALHDPLGDELPHPARAGEAVRAEAGGHPEPADVGLAEDELAVGRERLGAVHELHDLRLLQVRDADDRVRHQLLEALPVLGEKLAVEVGGNAVEAPGRRVALVAAHHQAAGLAAEVHEQRRVAHRRHVERDAARLRDQVLVGHRDHRHGDAGEPADLPGEHAARVDDHFRLDGALVGLDAGHAPLLHADRRHASVRGDLGAAPASPLGEGKRELARVDVAVSRKVGGPEHSLGRHGREELLRLLGGDQLQRQAERLRPACLTRQLLHALLRGGETQRSDLVPPRLEPDLVGERAVELDRAHHHPGQAERAAELTDQPGRVEGRAAREVGALDEQDVLPPQSRQPVENGGAADAAADDNCSRPVSHARATLTAGSG